MFAPRVYASEDLRSFEALPRSDYVQVIITHEATITKDNVFVYVNAGQLHNGGSHCSFDRIEFMLNLDLTTKVTSSIKDLLH